MGLCRIRIEIAGHVDLDVWVNPGLTDSEKALRIQKKLDFFRSELNPRDGVVDLEALHGHGVAELEIKPVD